MYYIVKKIVILWLWLNVIPFHFEILVFSINKNGFDWMISVSNVGRVMLSYFGDIEVVSEFVSMVGHC